MKAMISSCGGDNSVIVIGLNRSIYILHRTEIVLIDVLYESTYQLDQMSENLSKVGMR